MISSQAAPAPTAEKHHVSLKIIRQYLAQDIPFQLVGSDKSKTILVQSMIGAFIRQRRAAVDHFQNRSLAYMMMTALDDLDRQFNLIQNYSYWRHCYQVAIMEDIIVKVLPNKKGRHGNIHDQMIGLIKLCKKEVR